MPVRGWGHRPRPGAQPVTQRVPMSGPGPTGQLCTCPGRLRRDAEGSLLQARGRRVGAQLTPRSTSGRPLAGVVVGRWLLCRAGSLRGCTAVVECTAMAGSAPGCTARGWAPARRPGSARGQLVSLVGGWRGAYRGNPVRSGGLLRIPRKSAKCLTPDGEAFMLSVAERGCTAGLCPDTRAAIVSLCVCPQIPPACPVSWTVVGTRTSPREALGRTPLGRLAQHQVQH